jgi:hypothetical protein
MLILHVLGDGATSLDSGLQNMSLLVGYISRLSIRRIFVAKLLHAVFPLYQYLTNAASNPLSSAGFSLDCGFAATQLMGQIRMMEAQFLRHHS